MYCQFTLPIYYTNQTLIYKFNDDFVYFKYYKQNYRITEFNDSLNETARMFDS